MLVVVEVDTAFDCAHDVGRAFEKAGALIFVQTRCLFQRGFVYGIDTIFSMALLSPVAAMVLRLTVHASIAFWVNRGLNTLMGNQPEGLTSVAKQQGGIGLLLSILIVSVPPMAAMFFQGTLGSALTYSAFEGAGGRPGPQGQPPGMIKAPSYAGHAQKTGDQQAGGFEPRLSGTTPVAQADATKQFSKT
ncbi:MULTISPECIES: hypothetical protein [Rhodanobacteraceae]|uniref:hypothetical protein n=1 Tax=Rhodanobacteraceae TaxID=1775411 RepID=UPI0009A670F8|nr:MULTISPECIES: hypothetical protein [Rhodanobacteraceae]SKC05716.1 type IV secretion system protein VirB6 [Luteibacter sp. 22Crub2.1]